MAGYGHGSDSLFHELLKNLGQSECPAVWIAMILSEFQSLCNKDDAAIILKSVISSVLSKFSLPFWARLFKARLVLILG